MTGTFSLVRLQWRTSRWLLVVAPVLLAGLVCAVAGGVSHLYATPEQRAAYAATLGLSRISEAFNGRAYDLLELGGIAAYEVGFMGQIAIPVVGLVMAIRLTRHIEDVGVLELVTSGRVSRMASPLAAFMSCALAWTLLAALSAVGLVALDYPATGSVRYAVVMGLLGLAFSGIGLACGQVAASGRQALSLGLVLALGCALVRAVVDGKHLSATWASPLGWISEAHPWGAWAWWPVVALKVLALAGLAVSLAVVARRDLGSGLFPERLGRPVARPGLATPIGFVWRLTRHSIIGWWLGAVAWAAAIGIMTKEMVDVMASNPSLSEAFGQDASRLATVMAQLLTSVFATAAGLGVALRLGSEEFSGRVGLLTAGRLPRWRWWAAFSLVAVGATVLISLTATLVLGLVQWQVLDDRQAFTDALHAAGAAIVPLAVVVAFGCLLVAVAPRLRGLAWIPLAWLAVAGLLGEPLRLPEWAKDLSPLHWVGQVPIESVNWTALLVLKLVGVVFLASGPWLFGRRDLARG